MIQIYKHDLPGIRNMNSRKSIRAYNKCVAIVTGGASGIGKALSEELAKRGCEVIIIDLQEAAAKKVAYDINNSGGKASAFMVDVTNFTSVEEVVAITVKRTGRLDFLFNNAGIGIGGGVDKHSTDDWNKIIDVNIRGVTNGIQAAYPFMIKQGSGHIVNTASMAGLNPTPGMVSYAMTKHAVVGLSKSLWAEASQFGVQVSILCPGIVDTPLLEDGGKFGKMLFPVSLERQRVMWKKMRPMQPDKFARKALNAIARKKLFIILPSRWKALILINRLFPTKGVYISRIFYRNMKKDLQYENLQT